MEREYWFWICNECVLEANRRPDSRGIDVSEAVGPFLAGLGSSIALMGCCMRRPGCGFADMKRVIRIAMVVTRDTRL